MLSQRVRYALKAMLSLAGAEAGVPVLIATIAKTQNIPEQFLALILLDLKRFGLVRSLRGRDGGYLLAKPPSKITFGEVVRSIDGPIALLPCVSLTQYRRCEDCADEKTCIIRKLMAEVRASTGAILDRRTLQDGLDGIRASRPRAARKTKTVVRKKA